MGITVAKADGTIEAFDESKLIGSLLRSGVDSHTAADIAKEVEKELWSGISTQEIYSRAFARLREHRRGIAARYSLKRAVLDFGPSGFPFEAFIAELYRAEGYEATIDQLVMGACVEHEVDVVLHKGDEAIYAEAKFHNTAGFKTDLKTVLYVKARVDDIVIAHQKIPGHTKEHIRGLVVTNTKFTSKAIQYATCQNLELLGWDYPQGHTLHERIDKAGLYPITALTSLSAHQKMALLEEKVVLCTDLSKKTRVLSTVGITGKKADTVLEEVGALCVPGHDI